MTSKRKFCDHCKEFVTLRTYRLHADLYSNKASDPLYSSEDEEISLDNLEDLNVDHVGTGEPVEIIDDQEREITYSGTLYLFGSLAYTYGGRIPKYRFVKC